MEKEILDKLKHLERLTLLKSKEVLSPEEAALLMNCSLREVHKLTSSKTPVLSFYKPTRRKYIERDNILAYMRQNKTLGELEMEQIINEKPKRKR